MFRLWCFCGWGKVKVNPIPIRCPKCGKRLHVAALVESTESAMDIDVKNITKTTDEATAGAVYKYDPEVEPPIGYKPKKQKRIIVKTVQGIGDILWVYKKIKPYFDEIIFIIYVMPTGAKYVELQRRAGVFVRQLPGVVHVMFEIVDSKYYVDLSKRRMKLAPILYDIEINNPPWIEYACNRYLEDGIKLKDIDQTLDIIETVKVYKKHIKLPKKYIAVYISGGTCTKGMVIEKWVSLLEKCFAKYKLPLVFLGAAYDEERIEEVRGKLNLNTKCFLDRSPEYVMSILANASLLIGIQSGINILADNLDTPQVMVYLRILDNLRYAWIKESNTGIYAPVFEDDSVEYILNRIEEVIR